MNNDKKVLATMNEIDYKIISQYLNDAYPDKAFSKPEIISFAVKELAKRIENKTF